MDTNSTGNDPVGIKQEKPKQQAPAKEPKNKPANKVEQKLSGSQIYIGPNLPGGKLAAFTVFRYEIPAHIEALIQALPDLRRLIVPVASMSKSQVRSQTQGTAEYRAVQNLLKGES